MASFDEFLNPKSMVTPGIAGGLTTALANALRQLVNLPPQYCALAVSMLIAAVLPKYSSISGLRKLGFWALNALIIFSIAVGANTAALTLTSSAVDDRTVALDVTGKQTEAEARGHLRKLLDFYDADSVRVYAGAPLDSVPRPASADPGLFTLSRGTSRTTEAESPPESGRFFQPWFGPRRG